MFERMRGKFFKIWFLLVGGFILLNLSGCESHLIGMLNPKGIIAYQERKLFFDTFALMMIVVLPVIIMSFAFIYHYQESHRIQDYKPNWSHSYFLEALWWGIPCTIIIILAILTWKKTHELDPFSKIPGHPEPTLLVQVIALPWKWLFIYPEQQIATVNYLALPLNSQVEFWMTTDNVPMSAFFVPQLGSQIYAMAGMRTKLHLVANQVGTYEGLNSQFNGEGFSDMHFNVDVMDANQLQAWFNQAKLAAKPLDDAAYQQLLHPTIGDKPQIYSDASPALFQNVINLYMMSHGPVHPRAQYQQSPQSHSMPEVQHAH